MPLTRAFRGIDSVDQGVEDLAEMLSIILEAVCNVAYVGGICFATVLEFIDIRDSADDAEGERSCVYHCCRYEAKI